MPIGIKGFQSGNKLGNKNKGKKTGIVPKTAFKKGLIPWNKNKKGVMPTSWCKGTKGIVKAWNKNIPMSDVAKLKSSISHKGQIPGIKGKHFNHTEEAKQKIRDWNFNHPNRIFKDTNIEILIEQELIKRNISYQKQVPLCKTVRVDFYLPEYRIVIECDGDYWHNRPGSKENDERKTNLLTFNGFNVYRFWGHEIEESVEKCINKIIL